mmetsp:Transcript_7069/g.14263  ORF Transcript_7069/g.14263 Transcript_7069/m.14263 type:complete len:279 (-) Transcript_7069:2047-2883(-)
MNDHRQMTLAPVPNTDSVPICPLTLFRSFSIHVTPHCRVGHLPQGQSALQSPSQHSPVNQACAAATFSLDSWSISSTTFLTSVSTLSCMLSTLFATWHQYRPWCGSAALARLSTSSCLSLSPCWHSNLYVSAQKSPMSGLRVTARLNQFRAFSTLRSCQKSWATAAMTWGSLSHRRSASTLLDLRCGCGAIEMHSAHSTPEVGHSCSALAMRLSATLLLCCLRSVSTASSHSWSFLGFFKRPCSSNARAFVTFLDFSSAAAAAAHSATCSGHLRRPRA